MTEEKTAPVKPRRDIDKDSRPIDFRNGRLTLKLSAIGGVLTLLSFIGGYLGLKTTAPDPEVVKTTATDVGDIKGELIKLNAALQALAENGGRDRREIDRRLDEQQKAINDIKATVPTIRELDDLRSRVKALEDAKK